MLEPVDIFITPPHPCCAGAHQADSGSAVAPVANAGINSRIMFERYTEKARRVIFFARYEASQYGSTYIDTEHILLALLREDRVLMRHLHLDFAGEIRDEIDKVVRRGERVSTSVEMPLSADSKKILQRAAEEADRLADRHIDTQHILLGILRVEKSLAAKLLLAKGAKADTIRLQVAQGAASARASTKPSDATPITWVGTGAVTTGALTTLDQFLGLLKRGAADQLAGFFDHKGQFIDSSGKRWIGRAEIERGAETLLAPFAKKNASFRLEDTTAGPSHTFVASVLWEFAAASVDRSKSVLRMSLVLAWADEQWTIVLLQVTPVTLS
ncbi:MAG: ATPase domain protein [Candidatus Acidoferrum typicum]|nr:ATPase domain protein [Candidatus Acidoferrum typicum]